MLNLHTLLGRKLDISDTSSTLSSYYAIIARSSGISFLKFYLKFVEKTQPSLGCCCDLP